MNKFMNKTTTLSAKQIAPILVVIAPHLEKLMEVYGREGDWVYGLLEPVAIQNNDDVFVGFQIDLDGLPMMMLPTDAVAAVHVGAMKQDVEQLGYEVTPAMRILDTDDENKLAFGVNVCEG